MAYVETRGKIPHIKINRDVSHIMRAISLSSAFAITMFLKAEVSHGAYIITEAYVPSQSNDNAHNIVDPVELVKIGMEYAGICRCNLASDRTNIGAGDIKIFDEMTFGVDSYIRMQMNSGGIFEADIVCGDIAYRDVDVVIFDPIPKELISAAKEISRKYIRAWVYQDGYQQSERIHYPTPNIIKDKLGWRDIVFGGAKK